MGEGLRHRTGRGPHLAIAGMLAGLVLGSLATVMPAAASSGIGVFVGYADSLRADAANFPTPWAGSPQTTFEGCLPVASCQYDGGSIRISNNTGGTVTVNAIAVHLDSCTHTGWPAAALHPGAGAPATVIAASTGSRRQPCWNVAVQFVETCGPNAGRAGTGTADGSGLGAFS